MWPVWLVLSALAVGYGFVVQDTHCANGIVTLSHPSPLPLTLMALSDGRLLSPDTGECLGLSAGAHRPPAPHRRRYPLPTAVLPAAHPRPPEGLPSPWEATACPIRQVLCSNWQSGGRCAPRQTL